MSLRTLTPILSALASYPRRLAALMPPKKPVKRDLSKEFDDLTPSEQIAIRAAAKAAYKGKKLETLMVCADPGNSRSPTSSKRDSRTSLPPSRRGHGRARGLFLASLHRARPDPADLRSGHVRCHVRYADQLRTPAHHVSGLQDALRARLSQRQGPRTQRPRRSQAQGPEDRRVPDLRHSRGSCQARHRQTT